MRAFAVFLGFVATVVVGVMQYNRFETGIVTASVEHRYADHPCWVLGIAVDGKSAPIPEGITACPKETAIPADQRWKPVHLPEKLVEAAMLSDSLTITFTQFTPLFGSRGRMSSVSSELRRGVDIQKFPDLAAPPIYRTLIVQTAIPFAVGLTISVLLGVISRGKKSAPA